MRPIHGKALPEADMEVLLEILRHIGALVAVIYSEESEVFGPSLREILTSVRRARRRCGRHQCGKKWSKQHH